MSKSRSGFTIVELLIVIVVIAILATISIVAYKGIQQRANNTKTIAAVNQVIKAIAGYVAMNGVYPLAPTSGNALACVVPAGSACIYGGVIPASQGTTLINNLQTISTLPTSVPSAYPVIDGIIYSYTYNGTFNGELLPVRLMYSLQGESQKCGAANVSEFDTSLGYVSSTTGWTSNNNGNTVCMVYIMVP